MLLNQDIQSFWKAQNAYLSLQIFTENNWLLKRIYVLRNQFWIYVIIELDFSSLG